MELWISIATNNLGTGAPGDAQSIASAWILLSGLLSGPHDARIVARFGSETILHCDASERLAAVQAASAEVAFTDLGNTAAAHRRQCFLQAITLDQPHTHTDPARM